MKKNLMTVIILALVLVNLVLTAILAFTIIPQTRKSNQLIDKIASAIDLELEAKETLIKNDINTIVSGYTMEQFREDEQSVKDAILEDLQEMFGSDFIVGVSFSSVNTQ